MVDGLEEEHPDETEDDKGMGDDVESIVLEEERIVNIEEKNKKQRSAKEPEGRVEDKIPKKAESLAAPPEVSSTRQAYL